MLVFLCFAVLWLPRKITSSHRGFAIPWGKTWKNKTYITSGECRHFVARKDFVGFDDIVPFCRLRKNIFQIRYKQKTIPRAVSRHLVEWTILTMDWPPQTTRNPLSSDQFFDPPLNMSKQC